jgi:hypothetical protein
MRYRALAVAGMAVAFSSCSRRPTEVVTVPEPDKTAPPAVVHREAAAVADAAEADPQGVAASYFEALFSGDAARATGLATTPFSLDRKKILRDRKAVESMHLSVAEKKGKRPVPRYTIGRTDMAPALAPEVFPSYVAYRIVIDGEHVDVYVSTEAPRKVVGFSD